MDEIHAWKGRDLWEAIKSGMAKVDKGKKTDRIDGAVAAAMAAHRAVAGEVFNEKVLDRAT